MFRWYIGDFFNDVINKIDALIKFTTYVIIKGFIEIY